MQAGKLCIAASLLARTIKLSFNQPSGVHPQGPCGESGSKPQKDFLYAKHTMAHLWRDVQLLPVENTLIFFKV